VESQRKLKHELFNAFEEACVENGIPRTKDWHRGDNTGVGYTDGNISKGKRVSAATAFLNPVKMLLNLEIKT
jgi:choline dehydrogenase